MDLATIIGMLGASALVVLAISLGNSPLVFVNTVSLVIVVCGSLMVTLSQLSFAEAGRAMKAVGRAFKANLPDLVATIDELLELSKTARKSGLLALEDHETNSIFLRQGLQMLADGYAPEVLKEVLDKERMMTLERNRAGARAFTLLGEIAPAMGMIGTLIGLVDMLSNMGDPATIGPAMAVALLTTLYGVLIANIICNPIAEKMEQRTLQEDRIQSLLIDGLLTIQQGRNPRVVEQVLSTYLSQDLREKRAKAAEAAEKAEKEGGTPQPGAADAG